MHGFMFIEIELKLNGMIAFTTADLVNPNERIASVHSIQQKLRLFIYSVPTLDEFYVILLFVPTMNKTTDIAPISFFFQLTKLFRF